MIRPARPRLLDIDENITVALDLVRRRSLKHLINDRTMRYALHHAILIIAEAVHHLPRELRDRYPDTPWPNIKSIGDRLRHEYHRIDPEIVWDVATVHLKPLQEVIRKLLAELN